jgi:hypothetical protein
LFQENDDHVLEAVEASSQTRDRPRDINEVLKDEDWGQDVQQNRRSSDSSDHSGLNSAEGRHDENLQQARHPLAGGIRKLMQSSRRRRAISSFGGINLGMQTHRLLDAFVEDDSTPSDSSEDSDSDEYGSGKKRLLDGMDGAEPSQGQDRPFESDSIRHEDAEEDNNNNGGVPHTEGGTSGTGQNPANYSGPSIPLYSYEFLHLYDRDRVPADIDDNLFLNLTLAADLASWVKDPTALARVTNCRPAEGIFIHCDGAALDRSSWPSLSLESIADSNTKIDGMYPTWKVLKTPNQVSKGQIVGEITGKIGLLRDYSLDPSNRWPELRHPEPFVFFHPQLPIYIDSRHEGSILRYTRRSCRPNVTIKTYITDEIKYHFCFVAKCDIAADSEITATWYLDRQLFNTAGDSPSDVAAAHISKVLANFGGCACIPSTNCLLSDLDYRRSPKVAD